MWSVRLKGFLLSVIVAITAQSATASRLNLTPVLGFQEPEADVIGQAYSLSSPVLLYHELHYFSDDGRHHRVKYYSANGELLAEKDIDYSRSLLTPAFTQSNFNTGEMMSIDWQDNALSITHQQAANQQPDTKLIEPRYPLVIDAGFDHFIREHWQTLTQGKVHQFHFPVAARMGLIKLRLKRFDCSEPQEGYYCFRIEANNALLRWLLEPIELTYSITPTYTQDEQGQQKQVVRLERFRGLANLNDSSGSGMNVDIRYRYGKTWVF
ncbi:hypothetical protein R50073_28470 [Maricurvus nonylphenolicus]|uniref:hypothetical protein n=1 Tax=Maricurvus nonylphenolicus TaxID=1008307 RepID=UPI0036F1C5D1